MGKLLFVIIILTLCGGIYGCGHTSLYKSWGGELRDLPSRNGRVEDVSAILGRPPGRCEAIKDPPPVIGLIFDPWQGRPVIKGVTANTPAYQAGIRPGDIIRSIGGQPVVTKEQAQSALTNNVREGQALDVKTDRGVVSVVPKRLAMEQCYWKVQGGRVATAGGSAYESFFQASCRVLNGFVAGCQWDWRE